MILGRSESFAGTEVMLFQVGIGSLGGTVFSGGTYYPSANYGLKILANKEILEKSQDWDNSDPKLGKNIWKFPVLVYFSLIYLVFAKYFFHRCSEWDMERYGDKID